MSGHQRSTIDRTLIWRIVDGPALCARWAGNFSFISAKTYNLGVEKKRLDERVLLTIQNLGFCYFHSTRKLCFRHSKELFPWDSSFEHLKSMSLKFVIYRNCYFCYNPFYNHYLLIGGTLMSHWVSLPVLGPSLSCLVVIEFSSAMLLG